MLTVITSFGPEGYETYGRKFIETFREFWHPDVKLICAWEGAAPDSRLNGFDLLETESARSFLERHRTNLVIHGRKDAPPARWAPKAKRLGYSFRHDAYKFARKVFAIAAAAKYVSGGKLFWIDADVVTYRDVSKEFLNDLLPETISFCYLKRQNYHSELGFVGYNLHREETRRFIELYEKQYVTDAFLNDVHWDDCNQFDYLMSKLSPTERIIIHTRPAQPFNDSILGKYMRHNKGNRK